MNSTDLSILSSLTRNLSEEQCWNKLTAYFLLLLPLINYLLLLSLEEIIGRGIFAQGFEDDLALTLTSTVS